MGAHSLNRLSARTVATARDGKHADGGGLFLVVKETRRRWVLRYTIAGKSREMGLGGAKEVSLAQAREAAQLMRAEVRKGKDPLQTKAAALHVVQKVPSFGEMADELLSSIETGFRNEKHRAQWRMTLREYASPLREKAVDLIDTQDVLNVLQPIWLLKPETASRLRGRIERVLDAAAARGLTKTPNPARWRGHLAILLPKGQKLIRGHHKALNAALMPSFIQKLRMQSGLASIALEFTILTASRTNEALGAEWREINFDTCIWTVPALRMKTKREHRVPLSEGALALLRHLREFSSENRLVFPGQRQGRPLSQMSMLMTCRRMGESVTVHGFRSSFRDWAGDDTDHARETIEASLAHVIGDASEQAYRRSDAIEKRRRLMEDWSAFILSRSGHFQINDARENGLNVNDEPI